jgi:hypothetical protein
MGVESKIEHVVFDTDDCRELIQRCVPVSISLDDDTICVSLPDGCYIGMECRDGSLVVAFHKPDDCIAVAIESHGGSFRQVIEPDR